MSGKKSKKKAAEETGTAASAREGEEEAKAPTWKADHGEDHGGLEGFTFARYTGEEQLPAIMELVGKDLSEPYSVYTYRYFVNNWPDLTFLVLQRDGSLAGCCVSKLDFHQSSTSPCLRGYIAMLAVKHEFRGKGLVTKRTLFLYFYSMQ